MKIKLTSAPDIRITRAAEQAMELSLIANALDLSLGMTARWCIRRVYEQMAREGLIQPVPTWSATAQAARADRVHVYTRSGKFIVQPTTKKPPPGFTKMTKEEVYEKAHKELSKFIGE